MAIDPVTTRAAISARLATIPGLEVRDYLPDALEPPIAVCWPVSVDFDETMGRGHDRYTFSIAVLIDRADAETAQSNLDKYLTSGGEFSVKAALEGRSSTAYQYRTLDGLVSTCRVEAVSDIGVADHARIAYLYAEFTLLVVG